MLAAATLKTNRKASVQTVRTSMEKRTFPIGGEAQKKMNKQCRATYNTVAAETMQEKRRKPLLAQPRKEARKKHLGTPRNSTGSKATYENMFEAWGLCPLLMVPEVEEFRSCLI